MTKLGVTPGPAARAEPILARGAVVGGVIAGKYRIERVIGHGGMGVVVAASHLQLERTVAIKLIRGDWADDPLAVERLVREAKALASIRSEHVARVLDVGTLDDGIPFIVMEYLEGRDLATLLERDGPLPIVDAIDFIMQACEALAEAHRNGIVHRDIKPANLFVARQPGGVASIKVVDFGISKLINSASVESLTHPSRIVGSLYHMAPEQMRGEAVDARTDVWALGVLLFELITGRKPFPDAAWPAVCARVLNEAAPPLAIGDGLPEELAAALRRCLSRAPEDRYANVAELAVALSPLGSRSARVSLERIVRLATSTGSLAAESLSPLPPGARASLPPAAAAQLAERVPQDTTVDPASGEGSGPSSFGSDTSILPGPAALLQPAGVARAGAVFGTAASPAALPGTPPARAAEPVAREASAAQAAVAGVPRRRRRELWGAAVTGLSLLIGLPWLCARARTASTPMTPPTEVAHAALLPVRSPEAAPAAPLTGVEARPAAAESAPAFEENAAAPREPAPAVAVLPAPAERATPSTVPSSVVPTSAVAQRVVAPGVVALNPVTSVTEVVPASQLVAARVEGPPRTSAVSGVSQGGVPASAQGAAAGVPLAGAAKSPAHPPAGTPAPAPARGSNPWDLRDLEFE